MLLESALPVFGGRLDFARAVERNLADAAAVASGGRPQLLFFEPAAPLLTLGRRAQAGGSDVAESVAVCRARGVEVAAADRGGLATLHLPGQLVVFLAVPLPTLGIRFLVRHLLDSAAAVARRRGCDPQVRDDHDAGLWLADAKLASVGLRVQRGVVLHGMALNVALAPEVVAGAAFPGLTLCGHANARLADLGARAPAAVADVAAELARQLRTAG
ncbi:MAG: hypothetical protein HY902_09715 [Deltaproteobacteria bacterium]|nr:hypothetical protein [Deltaproteobacteria bacterium]